LFIHTNFNHTRGERIHNAHCNQSKPITMIKEKSSLQRGIEIDLTGSQGNAFYLLGTADNLAKQLGIDSKPIVAEMMESDYEHLVATFDKHFGHIVTLLR